MSDINEWDLRLNFARTLLLSAVETLVDTDEDAAVEAGHRCLDVVELLDAMRGALPTAPVE